MRRKISSHRWTLILSSIFSLALLILIGTVISRSQPSTSADSGTRSQEPDSAARLFITEASAQIAVSGTVTGPEGPVPGVWIGVGSPQDWQEATTNANGFYSLSIDTDGQLWFHVRPDVTTRLTQVNFWTDGVTASFTQDFTLTNGNLLSLGLTGEGGAPVTGEIWFEVSPMQNPLPEWYWYGLDPDDSGERYRAVLPPDIYYVTADHLPDGYYPTTQPFDLRTADLTADVPLNTAHVHPIPYDPPDASQITIGPPDDPATGSGHDPTTGSGQGLGEAVVTGAPGAALPLAQVFLVNLNSTHQAHAISEADGSFTARIYAPPGSAIMIKHGPPGGRWGDLDVGVSEGLNPFPGTIINVPYNHAGAPRSVPFAAVGAVDLYIDDPNSTRNYVGAAWAISGTIGPVVVEGQWTRVLTGTYDGETMPGLYLGGLNWTHPALGDLDADGDLDLLVGERSGHLVLYRNRGSTATPDWQFETAEYTSVATDWWAYPALADVTNDGALDLFVGTGDGRLSIYYNQGTPASPVWREAPDVSLAVGNQAAPALDDLDGDSDLDLLVGHAGGTLYHFRNSGTASAPAWTRQSNNYAGISEAGEGLQPVLVDLDGDGDRDLLLGLCGQLVWYQRGGSLQNPTWTRVAGDPIGYGGGSCANSPAIADWDGDGDSDLVIGEHWGVLRFFRNDGPAALAANVTLSWTEQHFPFPFDLQGDSAPALADWDHDGDLDLLLAQAHGNVHRYTNVGSPTTPSWRPDDVLLTLPWTNHPHPFPTFADIDGDNDDDLFIGEGSWEGPEAGGNIRFYRNDGTPAAPNWTLVTVSFLDVDVGGWSTPVFADIDSDDDLDLFIGDEAGTLTFAENTGSATSPSWATPIRPYAGLDLGSYSAPSFLDVDQDGDLDMLVGLEHGSLAYVRNVGTAGNPAWELVATSYPEIDVGERATPTAADGDGDGQPDLLIGDGDGGLNLYLYEGPGAPPAAGDIYAPGDSFQIEGILRLHSPAITATTDIGAISAHGWLSLQKLFDQEGHPLAAENYFMSTLLTPSGFPIQRSERPMEWLGAELSVDNLHYLGGHAIAGDVALNGQIPGDLAPGIYRPVLHLDFAGVPTSTAWLAANVTQYTFDAHQAALPPLTVGQVDPPHLIWRLLMDDLVQGTRGAGAREDRELFELASQIVSQGTAYSTPPVDVWGGQPLTYRLEPFLPMISFTDRRMPAPPLIPFHLPSGQLCVSIQEPEGTVRDLGCDALAQSFNRTKTTRRGQDLNSGTVQLEDVYSLMAAEERFRVTFDQYGQHVVTMTGVISDVWGNTYTGGGTYDLWIAHALDIDPGVLPETPLAVGDGFNPTLQFYPRVPARVNLTFTLYPDSDPTQVITYALNGQANRFGYYCPPGDVTRIAHPGEYRVDLTAIYTDTSGQTYMGAMTWGGVVMTPANQAQLIAHGRRGLDSLTYIPNHWFVAGRDLNIPAGAISHALNPYYNGDILWSRMSDETQGGNALVMGASVQDTVGDIEAAIRVRADRAYPPLSPPGGLDERFSQAEIPLFISTRSGQPAQTVLGQIDEVIPHDVDQIAYSYRTSQRPGVRVREVVAEDGQSGGYWRLDTLYDDQLGVGIQGDQPNDFKFQYVGTVYRDLENGHNEYAGQGTGWVFIPDDDPLGNRVMPPFAGPGNGGWTDEGGPILTLKGEEIHIFILPTGTRPGAVLEVGDTFRFAGHIMPTLDSRVAVTVTAPSGALYTGGGQANSIGYFYDPDDDFVVNEPGRWSVDARVWHDGTCSGGQVDCDPGNPFDPSRPCPSGDVLGSEDGRYWFYVVPGRAARLDVSSPTPGFLSFGEQVTPITITGSVPVGVSNIAIDYTLSMPGYILAHGQATLSGSTYQIVFDPVALHQDFPNLDLIGRDDWRPGLADTFAFGLLVQGVEGGKAVYHANTITIQGQQVFVGDAPPGGPIEIYLPLTLKGG